MQQDFGARKETIASLSRCHIQATAVMRTFGRAELSADDELCRDDAFSVPRLCYLILAYTSENPSSGMGTMMGLLLFAENRNSIVFPVLIPSRKSLDILVAA